MNEEALQYSYNLFSKDGYNGSIEDYKNLGQDIAEALDEKERFAIHRTYVKRVNIMSKQSFYERYDTPYYCSPSSETYWCM